MKKLIALAAVLAAMVIVFTSATAKPKAFHEAFYQTNLHCKNCAAKIQDNIAFEKGVKDLKIDVDAKTVRVKYDANKTDAEKLAKAIRKLGYTCELIEDKAL